MFGIGMPELLIILVVALIVVGPRKLPDIAKGLGKGLSEFRKATDEIKSQINENETFKDVQGIRDDFKETVDAVSPRNLLGSDAPKPEPKETTVDPGGQAQVTGGVEAEQTQAGQDPQAADNSEQTPPAPPAEPGAQKKADA